MPEEQEEFTFRTDSQCRRILLGRRLYGVGGFVLACCFFLPAVKGCNSPHIPAEDVWEGVKSGEIWDWSSLPLALIAYISSYLFGLLVLITAIRCTRADIVLDRRAGSSVLVLMLFVCISLICLVLEDLRSSSRASSSLWVGVAVSFFSVVYFIEFCRRGAWGLICIRLCAAVLSLAWFSHFLIEDPGSTLYGLWFSMIGGVAILVGTVIEAMGVYRVGALTILKKALICSRPPPTPGNAGCRACGYLLIGLTTPRCPECGLPFDHPIPEAGLESTSG